MGPAGPPGPVGPTGPAAEPWPSSVRSRFGPAGEAVLVELAITGTACPSSEYVVPAGMAFAWSRVYSNSPLGNAGLHDLPLVVDGIRFEVPHEGGELWRGPYLLPPGTTIAPVCDWRGPDTVPTLPDGRPQFTRLRLSGELFAATSELRKLAVRSRRDPMTNQCAVEASYRPPAGRRFRILHAFDRDNRDGHVLLDGAPLPCAVRVANEVNGARPAALFACSPPLIIGDGSSLTAGCRNSGDASELDLNEILVIGVEL
jgi:hypothetical protein